MKTNFHNKNFALSLAFIMRFKATPKWPEKLFFFVCMFVFVVVVVDFTSFFLC